MGLRDALKARVKAALGVPSAPPNRGPTIVAPAATPPPPTVSGAPPAGPVDGEFRKVAGSDGVREGKPGIYVHAGMNVAVFRRSGALFAMDNACAHEDGPIGEGTVDGNYVRCPYHDWQYDFTTGACLTDPERPRATFAVREWDGSIWLGPALTVGSMSRGGDHDDGMEVIRK